MPINGYRIDDPFDNHPLFKTEEQGLAGGNHGRR